MQLRSRAAGGRQGSPAQDAARYGTRLMEIAEQAEMAPGEGAARARDLLKQAADAAQEAALLLEGVRPSRVRMHVNTANQPELILEAVRYLLERQPGETPVTLHQGATKRGLPFAVHPTARLVAQLRALLGEDAVWTETRA